MALVALSLYPHSPACSPASAAVEMLGGAVTGAVASYALEREQFHSRVMSSCTKEAMARVGAAVMV